MTTEEMNTLPAEGETASTTASGITKAVSSLISPLLKSASRFFHLDWKYFLPEGLMASLRYQESSGSNAYPKDSSKGARGYFQFMTITRNEVLRKTGLDAWSKNINEAAGAAAYYLSSMLKQFDGDLLKALSAYNTGARNVKDAIRKYGEDGWLATRSKETREFAQEILDRLGLDHLSGITTYDVKAARLDAAAQKNAPKEEQGGIVNTLTEYWKKATALFTVSESEPQTCITPPLVAEALPLVPDAATTAAATQALFAPPAPVPVNVPFVQPKPGFSELVQKIMQPAAPAPAPAAIEVNQNDIKPPPPRVPKGVQVSVNQP